MVGRKERQWEEGRGGGKNNGFRRSRMPIVFLCLCEIGRTIARAGAQKQNNTGGEFYSSGQETDAQIGSAEGHEPSFVRFTWDSLSLSPPKMDMAHGPMLLSHIWRGNAAVLIVCRAIPSPATHPQYAPCLRGPPPLHRLPHQHSSQSAFPSHRDKINTRALSRRPKRQRYAFPSHFPIWKERPGRSSRKVHTLARSIDWSMSLLAR